jgi:hypothetical protein
MDADLECLERSVANQAPPDSVVVGVAIAPDGRYGAALVIASSGHPLDYLLERTEGGWQERGVGSGCGTTWCSLDESGELGVLRFSDQAPAGSTSAHVTYENAAHRVPVRHGHFLFVSWYVPLSAHAELAGFD